MESAMKWWQEKTKEERLELIKDTVFAKRKLVTLTGHEIIWLYRNQIKKNV